MPLKIELQRNRDVCGRLSLFSDRGKLLFGPVWCAGRANDAAAARRGNDSRSYLLPYGDTPLGLYKIDRLISMQGSSSYARRQFGRFGIVSLRPIAGAAMLADSVGRFALWISGGRSGGDARLATTNGSIRLSDDDLFGLINALKGREGDRCEIVEATKGFEAPAVFLDNIFDEGDPPSVSYAGAGLVPEMIRAVEKRSPRTMLMGEYDGGEAPEVDQDFISRQEGGQLLNAYTLDPDRFAESGVTVGTGVDLGQLTQDQLDNMDVPQELKDKLQDYVGLRGQDAVDYLRDNPLTVSKEEADQLDRISLETTETQVGTHFDNASQSSFSELPSEARTVIVDLSYQYGTNLATRTPRFWAAVTEGRWDDAVSELRNFGDRHGDRRNAEADLLQQAIDSGRLRGQPEN